VARLTELPQIERLPLAKVALPEGHPDALTTPEVPVYAFLIRHPDGAILVDTGVGRGNAYVDEVYQPAIINLPNALADLGVDHRDVAAVVNSHLHFDHCGQNPTFYGLDIPVYVQSAEVEAATALHYTDLDWATVPPAQLRRVDGDEELAVGVRLLATPGHTSGHQSVLVEGGDDVAMIVAQSAWSATEFATQKPSESNVEDQSLYEAAEDSIRRLRSFSPSVAYFSHDSEVYRP
jgi:N-acyl homoserine lactone hydrolase